MGIANMTEKKYRALFELIDEGFCLVQVIRDENDHPVDMRYLELNGVFEKQTGLHGAAGKTHSELGLKTEPHWFEKYGKVARTGVATRFESYHQSTQRWYNVFVSPVDGDGRDCVALLFNDVTKRRRSEQALRENEARQAFLLRFSDTLRLLTDPAAAADAACRLLVEQLDASRAQFTEVEGEPGAEMGKVRGEYIRNGKPLPRRYPLNAFGESLIAVLRHGETLVLADTATDTRVADAQREAFASVDSPSAVAVPLVKQGRLVAAFTVHDMTPRNWHANEIALVEQVAERTWEAFQRACVEAMLRASEERQAFLLKLGNALRAEFDPEVIGTVATHMLAEHMGVDRSYICRLSRDGNLVLIGSEYHASGVASIAGEYRLADFPASMRQLKTRPLAINDLLNDPTCSDLDKRLIGAMGMQAVFTGMLRGGVQNHVWTLVVGHSRPRIWTDGDRMLVQAAAERTWAGVARARVEVVLHENEARYRSVVESATDGIWLADRDGRFIEVNAAGCRMLGYTPEQYRQLGVRDLIQPEEGPRLRTLVETLEQGGQSIDTWRIRHANGHYVPVESSQCFTPAGYWQIIGRDVSERERIECELQQRSEQFVTLLSESPMGVYLVDSHLRIRVINPAARKAAGGADDMAGHDFDRAMHDLWSHDFADELVWRVRHILATGEPYFISERPERRGDETVWYAWHVRRTAIPGDGDGVVCYMNDVTDQVRARERQQLLLMEINHRVKNTLATVQSIVAQSLRNASTLDEGAAALESRLISLSSAHNVLVREHWEGGELHEVVENTLSAYPDKAGASRFRVSGIGVRLQPKAVVSLSMALHELATNAVKYGALSGTQGYVDIAWEIDDDKTPDRRFRLRWSEHDGPPVHVPENRGFGSRLIERGLAMDMEGEAHLDFDPDGLICTIIAPLDKISGETRWGDG